MAKQKSDDVVRFVDSIIEDYKDGRVGSYLMLTYLNQIKTKVQEASK